MTDTTATSGRVSPDGYVQAVVAALGYRGVQAGHVHTRTIPARHAIVSLTEVDPISTMWRAADWIGLSWRDDRGWALHVQWRGEPAPRAPLGFAVATAPSPDELAAWVVLCLIHPDLTVREDDTPITTPDLEEVLRAYPANTAG